MIDRRGNRTKEVIKKCEWLGIALDDFKPGERIWWSYDPERGPIFTKIKPHGVKAHIEGGNTPT